MHSDGRARRPPGGDRQGLLKNKISAQEHKAEYQPRGEKQQPADRSDGAEALIPAYRQDVKTAAEDDDTAKQQPADQGGNRFGKDVGSEEKRNDQQAEGVDEVVEHGPFVDADGV